MQKKKNQPYPNIKLKLNFNIFQLKIQTLKCWFCISRNAHIKTTMRCHLTPVKMAFIIKRNTNNVSKDVKKETAYPVDKEKKVKQNSITVVLQSRKRCHWWSTSCKKFQEGKFLTQLLYQKPGNYSPKRCSSRNMLNLSSSVFHSLLYIWTAWESC